MKPNSLTAVKRSGRRGVLGSSKLTYNFYLLLMAAKYNCGQIEKDAVFNDAGNVVELSI
jgi:hypothetical protein